MTTAAAPAGVIWHERAGFLECRGCEMLQPVGSALRNPEWIAQRLEAFGRMHAECAAYADVRKARLAVLWRQGLNRARRGTPRRRGK